MNRLIAKVKIPSQGFQEPREGSRECLESLALLRRDSEARRGEKHVNLDECQSRAMGSSSFHANHHPSSTFKPVMETSTRINEDQRSQEIHEPTAQQAKSESRRSLCPSWPEAFRPNRS